VVAVVALLGGCGGSQPGLRAMLPLSGLPQSKVHEASAASGDLIYVVSGGVASFYTYPQGRGLGYVDNGVQGVCPDAAGHVWETTDDGYVYEYANGSTKPIKSLDTGLILTLGRCAFDKSTGNLAVTVIADPGVVVIMTPNTSG